MSGKKITYSTELMVNFRQNHVVSPQRKFQALQTADGNALLFSISDQNVFYLTEQTPGTKTGWQQTDLSSGLSVGLGGTSFAVKTFAVSQNKLTRQIDLAMAVTVADQDFLYLSLNNEASSCTITPDNIKWMPVPYDDPDHKGIKVQIEGLYIAQSKAKQYIVADISRRTFVRASNFLERYFIKTNGEARRWCNLNIGADLDPGVHSCLGRKKGALVEAIYTLGAINGKRQLLYAPVDNGVAPPTITRLTMPEGASAIAVAEIEKGETDLFIAANKSLYYFARDNQKKRCCRCIAFKERHF